MRIIIISLLIMLPFITEAQKWKRTRYELVAGIGPSMFLGELGGSYKTGTHFLGDLDIQTTRYNLMAGVRYKIREKVALKVSFIYGRLTGSDRFTTNEGRLRRGATFFSGIFETSAQIEYSLLKERFGTRYTFQYMKKFSFSHVNTYLFLGTGGFYFNPHVTSPGTVLTNKNESYSKINLAFPIGIGFKYGIDRRFSLGVEIGQRLTSTDYIDGWSDKNSKARDSYGFMIVNLTYKLRTARSGLPKF